MPYVWGKDGDRMIQSFTKDNIADAVYINFIDEPVHHTEELDDNRLIDYSIMGRPVGIDLTAVSDGVKLDGLPEIEEVEKILISLGIKVSK